MNPVLLFLASGAVVVAAGAVLARCGDAIAEATRIGRVWIGSVLLAGATSLPELSTDLSAIRLGAPDLAVGDLFGSSMANMLILAVIDLWPPRGRVLQGATLEHALAASFAIALNALAAVLVLVRPEATFAGVGAGPLVLFAAYVVGMRAVFRNVPREAPPTAHAVAEATAPVEARRPSLRRAVLGFVLAAGVVLAVAPTLAASAKEIAEASGLGHTFVGTWLVGLATSLPELAVSIVAVRMGSFDLAVGNLFGSNAFNMALFLPLDLAHPGSLFAALDPRHALSGGFAVVLMALGTAALVYRAKRRTAMLEPDSVLILAAYLAALWLLHGA